jgi:hypothetical protein
VEKTMTRATMDLGDVRYLVRWIKQRLREDFEAYEQEHGEGSYPPGDPPDIYYPLWRVEDAIQKAVSVSVESET